MDKKYKTVEDFAADESFQDYCLNKSAKNNRKWEKYISKNPNKKKVIEEAKFFVMLISPIEKKTTQKNKVLKQSRANIQKIAALIIVILGTITIFKYHLHQQNNYKSITKIAEHQNLSILLTDLSKIDLRKTGSLTFKETWEQSKSREVWLKGEAYFDVEKNRTKDKKFIVHLEKGSISVLGTKFLVKSDSISTKVILEEGKILFKAGNKNYELTPGDVLHYNDDMVSIHHNQEIKRYDSWRKNEISFQKTPIEEVIETIKNSYNLDVSIGDENLKGRKITTTIKQNDPMLLLQAIAAIYDIEIILNENKIILK